MADRSDPRYRGRRRAAPQRKPGHLRSNYREDDLYLFRADLEKVCAVWPEKVREGDRRAQTKSYMRTTAIACTVVMVPVTAIAVWMAIDGAQPWWMVPVAQTAILIYMISFIFMNKVANRDEDIDFIIYREADRRGIKYKKGTTPLYHIMNRINADYNSYLWNRNFKWT